jgi:hypothetical protein
LPCRIAGYFEIAAALGYFDAFELEGVGHTLDPFAADGAWGVSAANDLWRDEEAHFVD